MEQADEIKMKLMFCFDKIVFLFHLFDKVKTKMSAGFFQSAASKLHFLTQMWILNEHHNPVLCSDHSGKVVSG